LKNKKRKAFLIQAFLTFLLFTRNFFAPHFLHFPGMPVAERFFAVHFMQM